MSDKKRGSGGTESSKSRRRSSEQDLAAPDGPANASRPYSGGLKDARLERQIRDMDDGQLVQRLTRERKKLNAIAQKALEKEGSLDVQSLHEQNRVVEMLINEALLRRIEDLD
jgi:hypothetical protein